MSVTTMVLPGLGTLLEVDANHPATGIYTNVAQRVSIDGPTLEFGEKDNTNLDSPCKIASPTLIDPGTLSLTIQYDPADPSHQIFWSQFNNVDPTKFVVNWKLVFNDALTLANRSTATFQGWVKTFPPSGFEVEGEVTAAITIRLTSIPVIVPRTTSA